MEDSRSAGARDPVTSIHVLPVGAFLNDELAARGWTVTMLANRLRCPVAEIEALIAGERELTYLMARRLEIELGTAACVWLNLDALYRAFRGPTE